MGEMRLIVTHTGKGHALDCLTPEGPVITFDGDGGRHGASPMQHLLASIGACALMDVDVILKKKRLEYTNLRVECVGKRPDEGTPKPFQGVTLVFRLDGDVPQKAFDDAVRLSVEKYCSVGATVTAGAPVAFEAKVG
jgi:putative redox protein